jgi:arylsulfatase A-like enzyme
MRKEKIPAETPARTNGCGANSQYSNGYSGDRNHPGTLAPNTLQQKWMTDVTTRAILPTFVADEKPFALVFWSRDPDATQHNEGDSLNKMSPGINGESSVAGVRNADATLGQILRWLDDHAAIKQNTDVIVTSDHGFATIARKEIDRLGHPSQAESAQHYYFDSTGRVDTDKGTLPTGFLAVDLAVALKTKLWDPDRRGAETSRFPFRQVRLDSDAWEHSQFGNGLLGARIAKPDGSDADVIVAANGGSDLIYVPDGNRERIQKVVDIVLQLDYVGAVFVDDRFAPIAGTLPLSAINLIGATKMPRPSIVVAFRTFYLDPNDLQSGIQVSDTSLQEGQGMHGGFGRDQTYNNMAAFGPDFKRGFVDDAPVSNADIVPTLASILGFTVKPNGKLSGRVVREALNGGAEQSAPQIKTMTSDPAHGKQSVLRYQEMDGLRYLHSAELVGPK